MPTILLMCGGDWTMKRPCQTPKNSVGH